MEIFYWQHVKVRKTVTKSSRKVLVRVADRGVCSFVVDHEHRSEQRDGRSDGRGSNAERREEHTEHNEQQQDSDTREQTKWGGVQAKGAHASGLTVWRAFCWLCCSCLRRVSLLVLASASTRL